MRKLLKYLSLCVLVLAGLVLISAIAINKRLPEPDFGPEADILANEMLESLNKEAWDSLGYIQWTFHDKHDYIWNKKHNLANIQWDDYEVVLNLNSKSGLVYQNAKSVVGEEKIELLEKAWEYWCNDSFWLYAPFKIFDEGTKRGIVTQKDGSKGLMVSYFEGGATPGDSYLWFLDEENKPVSWQMWIQKLPIGGVSSSWENYLTLPGGAMIATKHKTSVLEFEISNIQAGQNLTDLGLDPKIFSFL